MEQPQKNKAFLISRVEAALLVGLSPRQFDSVIRGRLPVDAVTGRGATLRYFAPAVVAAMIEYRLEDLRGELHALRAARPDAQGEKEMEKAGLERLRNANASMAEDNLARSRGHLLEREKLLQSLQSGIIALRGAGGRIVQRFGNDAAPMFNDAIADFEAAALTALAAPAIAAAAPAIDRPAPDLASAAATGESGEARAAQ